MRLGTTSYIYPADILTNVRKLSGLVQDVELVLFEIDDPVRDLPDKTVIHELREIATEHDMTYTVHLPLNLALARSNGNVNLACRTILATLDLSPRGFITHLEDGPRTGQYELLHLVENSVRSLEAIGTAVGDLADICVENLEGQPLRMIDLIMERIPVSCCVDIGHLWKQGLDALDHLRSWLPRTRVVHIHGVGSRDHQSLSVIPASELDPVFQLLRKQFNGVLTIEVFNEADLLESLPMLK